MKLVIFTNKMCEGLSIPNLPCLMISVLSQKHSHPPSSVLACYWANNLKSNIYMSQLIFNIWYSSTFFSHFEV